MRDLKFRCWNGKAMIDLYRITPLALSVEQDGVFIPFGDKYAIMQYTGFEDVNGVEIYEGDIVDCKRYPEYPTIYTEQIEDIRRLPPELFGSELISRKVIGNIHENPDLLDTPTE